MPRRKQYPSPYRNRVSNALAALIRAEVPLGPIHPPFIEYLAKRHGIHPDYLIRIATSLTHRTHKAFPPGHPAIHTLGARRPRRRPTDVPKGKPSWVHREALLFKQDHLCVYCLSLISMETATIDHIVPRSKGGSHHIDNLQLTCWKCNHHKGILSDEEWREQLNRKQKLAHIFANPCKAKQRRRLRTTKHCCCHIHGCPPDCSGCRLCGHDAKTRPAKLICPVGESRPSPCPSADICTQTRTCAIGKAGDQ